MQKSDAESTGFRAERMDQAAGECRGDSLFWADARQLRAGLEADGWVSPDTYCNFYESLGDFPAVYLFMLYKKEFFCEAFVAYVGMSTVLESRLTGHNVLRELRRYEYWTMRWFKPTPANSLRSVERHYIRKFDPPWNTIGRRRGVALG